jgi:hypothetical protein
MLGLIQEGGLERETGIEPATRLLWKSPVTASAKRAKAPCPGAEREWIALGVVHHCGTKSLSNRSRRRMMWSK